MIYKCYNFIVNKLEKIIRLFVVKFVSFQFLYASLFGGIQFMEYTWVKIVLCSVLILLGMHITRLNQNPVQFLYFTEDIDLRSLYKKLNHKEQKLLEKASIYLCKEDVRRLCKVNGHNFHMLNVNSKLCPQSLFWINVQIFDLSKYKDTILEIRTPLCMKFSRGSNWCPNAGAAMYTMLGNKVIKELREQKIS